MTSCGGTSITISRRLIFTRRSTPGMIQVRPACLTPAKRPSRKITPRSYSCSTRRPANTKAAITAIAITGAPIIVPLLAPDGRASLTLGRRPPHPQSQAFDGDDLDALAGRARLIRARGPMLAAHEDAAFGRERTGRATAHPA